MGLSVANASCCVAEVIRATTWQIRKGSLWLAIFPPERNVVKSSESSFIVCKYVCVCVFARPFPSEDTALNEDDVYRSLEELAE